MPRQAMRHVLATLAYRTRQVVREVPDGYPDFDAGSGVRTPAEILHHMSSVLDFAVHRFQPEGRLRLPALSWDEEKARFESILHRLDGYLERGDEPRDGSLLTLLQGPICDALTHVGQLATLRRMAGMPVPGESFVEAPIEIGQLGIS